MVEATETGVTDLLRRVVDAAVPLLDEIGSFYEGVDGPQQETLAFLAGLAPLLRVINPPPANGRAGRKISPDTTQQAKEVAKALLQVGRCRLPPKTDRKQLVRAALDEMALDADALLARGGKHSLLYVVRPQFEAARRALAYYLNGTTSGRSVAVELQHRNDRQIAQI